MAKRERVRPAHVTIARTLGVAIVTGDYTPGETIPGEFDLADRFGVARNVIREALRMLTAKGLIESRRKTGTRVRERVDWNLLDTEMLGWMFEGEPPVGFVKSLFELRLIVEPAAAALAATHRTARQLSRLGHALELMTHHGLESVAGQAADEQFHAVLLEATANELLGSLSSSISSAVRWTTFFKYRVVADYIDSIPQHQALFDTIARADPAAAHAAATALIEQARRDTEQAMRIA
ncbi:MAG: FadR family transcriptional regulator [Sphingomonas sp.]|nr:MAG: FadR family transcriptional regulator [Sphingomonas sp.]